MISMHNVENGEYFKHRKLNTEELSNKIYEVNNENCMIHVFDKIGHYSSTKYLMKEFSDYNSPYDFLSLGEFKYEKYKRKYKYSFIVYNPRSYRKLVGYDYSDWGDDVFHYSDNLTISKIKQQNYPEDLYKCLNKIFKNNKKYTPETCIAFDKPWEMEALTESNNYYFNGGYVKYPILGIKILECS